MKRKVWDITVKDNPNRVVMGENDEFYTTDTVAYLVFNLQDKDFSPPSAVLTLENHNDGSLKNETVDVVDGLIEWEMPQRYIEHFGNWQGQLVYEDTKDGQPESYTSAPFSFVVNAHIGDKKKPSLVEIENWEKFIRDGTELIETWEDMEDLRQANEAQRQANYQELLDTGVLQTNINTKLEALEEEYAPKLTGVTAQLAQTESDLRDDIEQHGFDLRWNEHLVVDGDWTQALQQALNDSPNDGRTIFIGQDIRIDSTIIWPSISGDTSVNKPCTIQGMAKNRGSGVIGGYQKGEVAIEFTGEGALFDLRNGDNIETSSSVSFRDINLYGQDKVGSIGINADSLIGSNFENIQFRRFDVGMRTREVFYATFDNLRFFYNLSYGLNVEGEVNHTKFHRCNFSHTREGTGVRVHYGQTGVVFDGCWFEGNKTGIALDYCMQALIQGCYFEQNHNTMDIAGHLETGHTVLTVIGSHFYTLTDSRNSAIYVGGGASIKYLITMIGNTINHWHTSGVFIGGTGDKQVVDISNRTNVRVDYPIEVVLGVNGNGVFTTQLNASMQVGANLDITDTERVAKMEVFNRNGDSAGWVQVYKG